MTAEAIQWTAIEPAYEFESIGAAHLLETGGGEVTSVDISSDATRVVTGSDGGPALLWSLADLWSVALGGPGEASESVAFSRDGRWVVTVSSIAGVRKWAADGSGEPQVLDASRGGWLSAPSPDSAFIAVGFTQGTANLYPFDDFRETVALTPHGGEVFDLAVSSDGTLVASASRDGTARVSRSDDGAALALFAHDRHTFGARLETFGRHWMWSVRARVRVRHATNGGFRGYALPPPPADLVAQHPEVIAFEHSPDQQWIVTFSRGSEARVWPASGGEPVVLMGHDGPITAATFSPDGHTIATASHDATVRLWSLAEPQAPLVLRGHEGAVLSVRFSADGRRLVTSSSDRTVRVWSVAGEQQQLLAYEEDLVWAELADPEEWVVATTTRNTAIIRRLDGGETPEELEGPTYSVMAAAFTPDGRALVTGSEDGTARIWPLREGEEETILGCATTVWSVDVSPDGELVAIAAADSTARIWSPSRGEVRLLRGHSQRVLVIAFSPDGRWVATASDDGTARLWPTSADGHGYTLAGHTAGVRALAFSPDGRWIVTGSRDSSARVWPVP